MEAGSGNSDLESTAPVRSQSLGGCGRKIAVGLRAIWATKYVTPWGNKGRCCFKSKASSSSSGSGSNNNNNKAKDRVFGSFFSFSLKPGFKDAVLPHVPRIKFCELKLLKSWF